MENPLSHTRATNIIGRVLDQEKERIKNGGMRWLSLEQEISNALAEQGLLTEKAYEVVGLEGRET